MCLFRLGFGTLLIRTFGETGERKVKVPTPFWLNAAMMLTSSSSGWGERAGVCGCPPSAVWLIFAERIRWGITQTHSIQLFRKNASVCYLREAMVSVLFRGGNGECVI